MGVYSGEKKFLGGPTKHRKGLKHHKERQRPY